MTSSDSVFGFMHDCSFAPFLLPFLIKGQMLNTLSNQFIRICHHSHRLKPDFNLLPLWLVRTWFQLLLCSFNRTVDNNPIELSKVVKACLINSSWLFIGTSNITSECNSVDNQIVCYTMFIRIPPLRLNALLQ